MKRLLMVVCSLVLVGSATAATLASASGEASDRAEAVTRSGRFIHHQISAAAQRSALNYWTPARMESAQPLDFHPKAGSALFDNSASASIPQGGGRSGFIPGVLPNGSATAASDASGAVSDALAVGYSYPFPYDRYEVPGLTDYTAFPYKTIGKIFGTDATGTYECSGAAVISANESVVWTAGHCAHLVESGWFTNLIFVPGYRDGVRPFGEWVASDAWAMNRWLTREDSRFDVAAIVVNTNNGATLEDTVGSLGFAWSAGRVQHWQAFGYPAAPPFNGNRQNVCSASFGANDPNYRRKPPIGIGCDMTPGSSGGPWILDFGQGYYVNGVNSYSYGGLRQAMFSPYFTGGMNALLECAEDGVC
jgi:V8-like Glu-specific endopeptidase